MQETPDPSPRSRLRGWLGFAARIAATAALMAWASWGVDWEKFRGLIARADWRWWAAGLATTFVVQTVAGIRWAVLARPLGFDFPRRLFVRRFFEGMFFSLFLPSSIGGDVVKAVRIGSTTPMRLLAACSVLADRLTGLAALGVLVGTALVTREQKLSPPAAAAVFVGFLSAALVAFWIGLALLDRVHAALPEGSAGREFVARLLPYRRRPSLVLGAFAWSFIVQLGGVLVVALVARGLGVEQPPLVWLSVVPLVALLKVLPIAIGGFGVREKSLDFLLLGHGVPSETGIAIGLLWGLCDVISGLVGGLLFLFDRRPVIVGSVPDPAA